MEIRWCGLTTIVLKTTCLINDEHTRGATVESAICGQDAHRPRAPAVLIPMHQLACHFCRHQAHVYTQPAAVWITALCWRSVTMSSIIPSLRSWIACSLLLRHEEATGVANIAKCAQGRTRQQRSCLRQPRPFRWPTCRARQPLQCSTLPRCQASHAARSSSQIFFSSIGMCLRTNSVSS